jgi:hypothetical protein
VHLSEKSAINMISLVGPCFWLVNPDD